MKSPLTPADCPSGVLQYEHRIIERVLKVLSTLAQRAEFGQGLEREALGQCVEFFRQYADAFHHAKEEDLLFPVLEARGIPKEGGPIGVMLYEHKLGREMIRRIAAALQDQDHGDTLAKERSLTAIREYLELLPNHIYKEDHVLFPMGERMISMEDRQTLCKGFHEVAARKFQGKTPDEYEQLAETLAQKWSQSQ